MVGTATFASRFLGLVREQTFAFRLRAGFATDAFVASFRIPDLLQDLLAEGALSAAFVPVSAPRRRMILTFPLIASRDAVHDLIC